MTREEYEAKRAKPGEMPRDWLETELATQLQASRWVRRLYELGVSFHLDDDPRKEFVDEPCRLFTAEEADLVEERKQELHRLADDSWEPHRQSMYEHYVLLAGMGELPQFSDSQGTEDALVDLTVDDANLVARALFDSMGQDWSDEDRWRLRCLKAYLARRHVEDPPTTEK
jgi:hypothetical protein